MKSLLTILFTLLFSISGLFAQTDNNYVLMENSTMTIEGTSTIHDWECDVTDIQADINFDASALTAETPTNPVKSLALTIPVEKIESGKGGMNKKIYGALEEKKYPNITFELTSAKLTPNTQATNGNKSSFSLMATGMLTIAGTTNEVSFPVEAFAENGNTYKFTGSYELNMRDYKVDPPSAMFGTIKSGEMVTIKFEVYFSKASI